MKKICTFQLENNKQNFLEIDLYDNEVLLGSSIMFKDQKLSFVCLASINGKHSFVDMTKILELKKSIKKNKLYIYIYNSNTPKPYPWETTYIIHRVIDIY